MGEVLIRFRSTGGDVGPFAFAQDAPVQELRERLFAEWPTGACVEGGAPELDFEGCLAKRCQKSPGCLSLGPRMDKAACS